MPRDSSPQLDNPGVIEEGSSESFSRILSVIVLLAAVVVVYAPVRDHEFLMWDDNVNVYENPLLDPADGERFQHIWTAAYQALYIPITYTFLAGEAEFARGEDGKLDPRVFHIGNLLLHAANVLLVFALLRLLCNSDWAACAGAMLFAVHPLQAEPVSWVTETRGLLAAFFGLIALWWYLQYAQSKCSVGKTSARTSHPAMQYAAASLALLLALLSKPSAVAVVPMAIVLDVGVLRRSIAQSLRATAPWLIAVAMFVVLTKLQQPDVELNFFRDLWARPLVAADALAFYLYKLFVPLQLGPEYGRSPDYILATGQLYWAWLVPVAIAAGCWLLPGRRPAVVTLLLFIFAVSPVLGLVPFGYQARSTVADRYVYLAMLGPAFGIASIVALWPRRLTFACLAIVFVLLGWLTHEQVALWRDNATLFTHNLTINPRSVPSHTILGQHYLNQGAYQAAIEHFRQAAQFNRQPRDSWNNVGDASRLQARQRQAEGHPQQAAQLHQQALNAYQEALVANPHYARTHDNLGQAYSELGSVALAIEHYRRALEIDPSFVVSHHNLALALMSQGEVAAAIDHIQQAIHLRETAGKQPEPTAFIVLGIAQIKSGRYQDAIEAYQRALEIDPRSTEAHQRLDSLRHQLGQ